MALTYLRGMAVLAGLGTILYREMMVRLMKLKISTNIEGRIYLQNKYHLQEEKKEERVKVKRDEKIVGFNSSKKEGGFLHPNMLLKRRVSGL